MISCKPDLVKLFRFVLAVRPQHSTAATPWDALKVLSTFINRLEMTCIPYVPGEMPVIGPIGKETLPSNRCNGVPNSYEIGGGAYVRADLRSLVLPDLSNFRLH